MAHCKQRIIVGRYSVNRHGHGVLFLISLTMYKVSLHVRSALVNTGFFSEAYGKSYATG